MNSYIHYTFISVTNALITLRFMFKTDIMDKQVLQQQLVSKNAMLERQLVFANALKEQQHVFENIIQEQGYFLDQIRQDFELQAKDLVLGAWLNRFSFPSTSVDAYCNGVVVVLSTSAASPIPDPSEQLGNKRHSHPNSIGCWAEKDWFIYCFVSVALLSYDDYVDRIKGHPFFMDAVDMMTYVEDLHNCIHLHTVLSSPHFDSLLNWNENSKMKKWKYYMRCIYAYKNSDYSGGVVEQGQAEPERRLIPSFGCGDTSWALGIDDHIKINERAFNGKLLIRLLTTKSKWPALLEKCNGEHEAKQFYELLSHAITSGVLAHDSFVSSKLRLRSLPHGLGFSRALFSQIQNPNVFACNFIFKAYSHSSSPQEALYLYNFIRRRFPHLLPDNYSFPFLFKACSRLQLPHKGQELHALTLILGLHDDVFVQNGLVSMYSACGLLESARKVFDLVPGLVRDVVSWNSVISGCLQRHRNWDALQVFEETLSDWSTRPDKVTLVSALTASARLGSLGLGRKIHGLVLGSGFALDVFLGSSLIDVYAKCGRMDDARKVFDRVPHRNVVSWTSMIAGYTQSSSFKDTIELFREMQLEGVEADAAMVACVISACGHSGALDHGRWVHTYCERSGIDMNMSGKNALIDMYSKCGDIERALEIFHGMSSRDVFTWTAMSTGLAMNGDSVRALEMFSQMEASSNIRRNEVTFLGVLSACSHGGFVEKGFRTYGNTELAEFAARNIENLEPRRFESRVLLSNLYASTSRWFDVNKLRKDCRWGSTPLDEACIGGNEKLIKLLEVARASQLLEFSAEYHLSIK
ncbi:SLOW GROWTH 1 [Prunus dulcis]|uniref:SLOW GROWTH 1 n=1 Tax=Prunus dulcis TaxID=3755 RepID=A0A4Y1RHA7_PRUDU|nr:SLOW GROWTH 1 [Prunus dulcis]